MLLYLLKRVPLGNFKTCHFFNPLSNTSFVYYSSKSKILHSMVVIVLLNFNSPMLFAADSIKLLWSRELCMNSESLISCVIISYCEFIFTSFSLSHHALGCTQEQILSQFLFSSNDTMNKPQVSMGQYSVQSYLCVYAFNTFISVRRKIIGWLKFLRLIEGNEIWTVQLLNAWMSWEWMHQLKSKCRGSVSMLLSHLFELFQKYTSCSNIYIYTYTYVYQEI